ncbi:MAG: hypothetical protein IIV24_01105 [Alistipes sp.]|nr:hypothetical protein [Alistipes sp.]
MKKFIIIVMLALFALPSAVMAQEEKADSTYTHSLRRQNRGISNLKTEFVPKGQWVFGGSVSYSTHNNNNYSFLIIEDIQSTGYQFKVTPMLGYAYSKNSLVGVRFGYSRGMTDLDNASLSITSLDNANYSSLKHSYNVEALWRKYIPLGKDNKRFALFAEVGLAMGGSQSKLAAGPSASPSGTYATSFDVSVGVNPGISAFLTNNMAIEVNIGVFGFNYSNTRQVSNQVVMSGSSSSQMNFKVNIFSIGLGASFYL